LYIKYTTYLENFNKLAALANILLIFQNKPFQRAFFKKKVKSWYSSSNFKFLKFKLKFVFLKPMIKNTHQSKKSIYWLNHRNFENKIQ